MNIDGEKIFALKSEDERFLSFFIAEANQDTIGEKVQFVMFAETDGTRFKFAVANKTMEELLDNSPSEDQMTYQEFMDTYGDVEFRFADVSSIPIE